MPVAGPAGPTGAVGTFLLYSVSAGGMTEIHLVRLTGDGTAVVPSPAAAPLWRVPGVASSGLALVAGGGHLLAAAAITRADGTGELRATRLDADGTALDAAAAPLATGVKLAGGPTAAWDGPAALPGDVVGEPDHRRRPDRAPPGRSPRGHGRHRDRPARAGRVGGRAGPHLVAGPGAPLLLWEEVAWWTDTGRGLGHRPAEPARWTRPPPPPSTLVSTARNWQSEPAAASNGQRVLVAFEDRRDDKPGSDIYAARLTPEGQPLDRAALALATGAHPQREPEVAWDGKNFVVVWHEGAPRSGRRPGRPPRGRCWTSPGLVVPGTDGQHAAVGPRHLRRRRRHPAGVGQPQAAPAPQPPVRDAELRALRIPAGATARQGAAFWLTTTFDRHRAGGPAGLQSTGGVAGLERPAGPDRSAHAVRRPAGARQPDPGSSAREWRSCSGASSRRRRAWPATAGASWSPGGRSTWASGSSGASGWTRRASCSTARPSRSATATAGAGRPPCWDGTQYVVFAVHTQDGQAVRAAGPPGLLLRVRCWITSGSRWPSWPRPGAAAAPARWASTWAPAGRCWPTSNTPMTTALQTPGPAPAC